MLDAARRALELVRGKPIAELPPEDETALALARLLEILGEAARQVTPTTRLRHPTIAWRDIADTRNRIIHEYFDVDLEIIAAIVAHDLPDLIPALEVVLHELLERNP
jgi:uncharacterized protein with HEPN domain